MSETPPQKPRQHSITSAGSDHSANSGSYVRTISATRSPTRSVGRPRKLLAPNDSDTNCGSVPMATSLSMPSGNSSGLFMENANLPGSSPTSNSVPGLNSSQISHFHSALPPAPTTPTASTLKPSLVSGYEINNRVSLRQRSAYYLPILGWLPNYTIAQFGGDLIAGISLASFQIPLALSYATTVAHVPPVCGLYGLVVPPLVYTLFGSVPQMIVGPESAISLIVGQALEPVLKHYEGADASDLVSIIGLVAGLSLLFAGFFRFGYLENVLNGALLSGFITGVGVVMIVNGLIDELGLHGLFEKVPGHEHSPLAKIEFLWHNWPNAHYATAVTSLLGFAGIFVLRMLKSWAHRVSVKNKNNYGRNVSVFYKVLRNFAIFFPEILLVVCITVVVSTVLELDTLGVEVLGKVSEQHAYFQWPLTSVQKYRHRSFFQSLLTAGYVCAILGFFESATAQKSLGTQFDVDVSANRELVALGAINIAGAFFATLPSFGGYGRSKINALSGAQSTMSGAVMALAAFLMVQCLLPYLYYTPKCLLSVISSVIGISLLAEAPKNLRFHYQAKGFNELITFFITISATLLSSIELGIALGCTYSLLRVIKHSTFSRIQILARKDESFINADEFPFDDVEEIEGCLLVKIPEPLTFTNANDLKSRIKRLEKYGSLKTHPAASQSRYASMTRNVVFDLHGMTSIDSSAAQILQQLLQSYKDRGIKNYFCRVSRGIRRSPKLLNTQIIKLVEKTESGEPFFSSIEEALEQIDNCAEFESWGVDEAYSIYSRFY